MNDFFCLKWLIAVPVKVSSKIFCHKVWFRGFGAMEAVPRLSMLHFDLKYSPENTDFLLKLKRLIHVSRIISSSFITWRFSHLSFSVIRLIAQLSKWWLIELCFSMVVCYKGKEDKMLTLKGRKRWTKKPLFKWGQRLDCWVIDGC